MDIKLVINQACNGLELYFPTKPSETVLTQMKAAGWRYHRVKKCWYAKQTDSNRKLADAIISLEVQADVVTVQADEYFPPFSRIGDTEIFRSSEVSCWDRREGYFCDLNAYIAITPNRVIIRDLTDAMKGGKMCRQLILEERNQYSDVCLCSGLETFKDVYDTYFVRRELPDCYSYTSELRALRVFTPFKPVKRFAAPEKWTLTHVWKGILTGQIFHGVYNGRYTDDYAYDAHTNFGKGREMNLLAFAKDLIESPSGWTVTVDGEKDGVIQLSVDCHTYDFRTLYFDEQCDCEEGERRRIQRSNERIEHNARLEDRLLSCDQVIAAMDQPTIYDAEYLRMDDNTGRYEVERGIFLPSQLFDGHRLLRDVISIAEHPVADDDLFDLSCDDLLLSADERIIPTADAPVVTGLALREILSDEDSRDHIRGVSFNRFSLKQFREELERWHLGMIQNLLNPIPRERFAFALARLAEEEKRIEMNGGNLNDQG